jgi:AraC-like DNA-binding protein
MQSENAADWKRSRERLAPWRVKKAQVLMSQLMVERGTVEKVAKACALSRSHFSRAFKNSTGLSPHDWLRREKLSKAEQLLKDRRLTINQIALECGFADQSYFTRLFRRVKGVSPRRWQVQHEGNGVTVKCDLSSAGRFKLRADETIIQCEVDVFNVGCKRPLCK